MALFRSFATVGGLTAASRVLGFARDMLLAQALGTGGVADVFFFAFRFPNLFRRFFAEGAFNAAFVPLFARRLETDGMASAKSFAEAALAVLLTAVLLFTAAVMAAMPWLMPLVAPGFGEDPAQQELAVKLTRISFPYLALMVLVALFGAVLNSLYRYAAAAAAPILLNLVLILGLLFLVPRYPGRAAEVLTWTTLAAGVAQVMLLLLAAGRAGMLLSLPRPRLGPDVRRLLRLMGPGLLSAGAMQINLLVGTIIATLQAGAVSYLYYADRIYQLPLALTGIGLGIILLPELSRKLRAGLPEEAMQSLNRGLELGLFFTLPAAVALASIPLPIVTALFERGAFTSEASRATATALAAYAAGLPAFVLVKLLQPPFYAREDQKRPLRSALMTMAANVVLSLALFPVLGFLGLAIATSAASWLNAGHLAWMLRRRGLLTLDGRLLRRLPRMLLASLLMGAALPFLAPLLEPWLSGPLLPALLAMTALASAGLLLYGLAALALGAVRTGDLREAMGPRLPRERPQGQGTP